LAAAAVQDRLEVVEGEDRQEVAGTPLVEVGEDTPLVAGSLLKLT
jgi:hypothetical protein